MQTIDIVKPEPKTELELHRRWLNDLASSLMPLRSGSKKIKVTEFYDCAECGIETSYYKFGGVCGDCEAKGERYE